VFHLAVSRGYGKGSSGRRFAGYIPILGWLHHGDLGKCPGGGRLIAVGVFYEFLRELETAL